MRKMVILTALLAAVVIFSLGCISNPPSKPQNNTTTTSKSTYATISTLKIGYQPSTHQIAEMMAMDKGWWQSDLKPFGVTNVQEFQFPTGAPEMQAMLAGDLDVAYVGTAPPITAIAKGMDAKIIAGVNINGSSLVLRPGVKFDGAKSLIGLTIGTFPASSIQDLVLRKYLKDNGVDASKLSIKAMTQGDAVTALEAGKIDGAFLPHPAPAIIVEDNKGEVALHSGQMWANHSCCSVLVSGKLIRENPELVKQILKTHINATNYINAHKEEAAQVFAKKTGQDLNQVEYSIKTWDGKWISDPNLQVPSTTEYASIDYDLNYTAKKLTANDLFDTSFYNSVAGSK